MQMYSSKVAKKLGTIEVERGNICELTNACTYTIKQRERNLRACRFSSWQRSGTSCVALVLNKVPQKSCHQQACRARVHACMYGAPKITRFGTED